MKTTSEMLIAVFMKISIVIALVMVVIFPISIMLVSFLLLLAVCFSIAGFSSPCYRYVDIKNTIQKLE